MAAPGAGSGVRRRALLVAVAVLAIEWGTLSLALDVKDVLRGFGDDALTRLVGSVQTLAISVLVAALALGTTGIRAVSLTRGRRLGLFAFHLGATAVAAGTLGILASAAPGGLAGALLVSLAAAAGLVAVGSLAAACGIGLDRERGTRALFWGSTVGVLAWAAASATGLLWEGLSRPTLVAAAALLGITGGGTVVVDPAEALLGLDAFVVEVAPVCSGYEGMGLVATVVAGYALLDRAHLDLARIWWIVPAAVAASFLANIGRIAGLVLLGARVSPNLAMASFHSKAGWILASLVALGAITTMRRLGAQDAGGAPGDPRESEGRTVHAAIPFVVPLLLLVGTSQITGAFAEVWDRWELVGLAAAAGALWSTRRGLPNLRPGAPAVSIATGLVVYAVWIALEPVPDAADLGTARAALGELGGVEGAVFWFSRVAGSVVIVPVVEELAFRGYLARRLSGPGPFEERPFRALGLVGIAGAALAFGLLHQRWIAGILSGIAFGLLPRRTGRLGDAVLAHAVANAAIAVEVAVLGHLNLWR